MNPEVQPDADLAWIQWTAIHNLYAMLGLRVFVMEPVPLLHDMVFTANGGWGCGTKDKTQREVILSNFRKVQRQGERVHYRTWCRRLGYRYRSLPNTVFFEGQGDVITLADKYIMASGPRTTSGARSYIQRVMGIEDMVIPVTLEDGGRKDEEIRFYHLDTCMMGLRPTNSLVYYPGALNEEGQRRISDVRREINIDAFEVSEDLALRFVCNSVYVNGTILLNVPESVEYKLFEMTASGLACREDDPRVGHLLGMHHEYGDLLEFLWMRDYEVIPVYTSEFMKSGGGVRCLTLFLD